MHIKKLKVRPKKHLAQTMCGPQLVEMLSCWAAHNDPMSTGKCAGVAQELYNCMRTTPTQRKMPGSGINYQLARLQKVMK